MELKIENLTKNYQDITAVKNVTYSMHHGVYGLLGANGAGKTTFMRMLCTLLKPSNGAITWDGKDIFAMDAEYRKLLGYLPQDFGFYPDFTVQDYLMYIGSIKGIPTAVVKKRIGELLQRVGLTQMRTKKMKKLSGGMKRRVGIAQAVLNNPKILVLDEPTSGLDPNERIRFRNLISELSQDRLVLLSTHIVSDVEYIANEILLMKNGEIAHSGTPAGIMHTLPVRVWSCLAGREELEAYARQYQIANMKTVTEGAELRILSADRPCPGAKEEDMTLEDVFLYYFGERAGEEDAAL
ncbi:ABC transporter ATP-binding protein [Diplocloster hominis]|uniref:ABC transporter ATP-binding protein n=1 Tax=Diplocloster hominis TaxID=3079010 RepID=UPI0031BB1F4F